MSEYVDPIPYKNYKMAHNKTIFPEFPEYNSDLLVKKREETGSSFHYNVIKQEKEIISCLGISIEIPFMCVLYRNTVFLVLTIHDT